VALERLHAILDRLIAERKAELTPARTKGQPVVGYFCNYVPRELILAAGAIPIRLDQGGDYASRSRGERYLRVDACPFCKSCLGLFESDPLYKLISVIVAPSTCDQMRRLPEVIHKHFGIPILQMAVPRTVTDSARNGFRREVRWLRDELERLTGQPILAPVLARAMLEEEEKRSLLRAINETRMNDAPPVRETDILRLVQATNRLRNSDCVSLLRQHLIQLNVASPGASRPRLLAARRLLLAGSIVAAQDLDFVRMVADRAAIVTDLVCTGVRSFLAPLTVPVSEDFDELLTVLANHYFNQPGCIHRRPNTGYYELARRLIREYRVDGIILKTLLFCDAYNFEALRLERELGVPLLHVDTDYAEANTQQVRTRVEAFLEMLQAQARSYWEPPMNADERRFDI
jgi:benzoyl-CoA reductase/2-hydroxyglutaryl-CoA dehydratase subunit BcrC/BadD/HgdB